MLLTMKKLSVMLSLLLTALIPLGAWADEADDYRKFVEDTRAWVYSLDLPAFRVREIPEKYKNESAVYVAVYNSLAVIRNTEQSRLPGTLRFARDKRIEGGQLERNLILINDKSALEKFSEYDYLTTVTRKKNVSQSKYRFTVGVKVIKPDGTETIVDTDDYVEVKDDGKGRERRKLAVPGLEVGDMIDVFTYISTDIHNAHLSPMMFVMREDYPVMSYSIHWLLDGSLASSYRLLNGAPDFQVFVDGDQNYHLDMELADLPARPRLCYDDMLQSPLIKLFVFNPEAEAYMPKSSSAVGLRSDPFMIWIKKEWWNLIERYSYDGAAKDFLKSALKNGAKAPSVLSKALKSGERSVTEVADCAYNLMTFAHIMSDEGLHPMLFDIRLREMLKGLVGDSLRVVMTTSAQDEPLDQVASIYAITTGCALPDGSRYYFPPRAFMAPSELHTAYSGRLSQQYRLDSLLNYKPADSVYFTLPENRARSNRKYCTLNAVIDGTTLKVNRRTTCSGIAKLPVMSLLNTEDLVRAYLEYFDGWGLEIALKENGRKTADRLARYEDARIGQKEDFAEEISDFHGVGDVDSVSGRILSVGIDPNSPKLVYEADYIIPDMVSRAGRNLLLSVGHLIESNGELLERDRMREDFVVTKGAREYITRIEVTLPAGSGISEKSLAGLNTKVDNRAGMFASIARVDDGRLVMDVIKRFDHRFLTAESWPEMVELMDAEQSWRSGKVLIEL